MAVNTQRHRRPAFRPDHSADFPVDLPADIPDLRRIRFG
jgi:hypothetical protein